MFVTITYLRAVESARHNPANFLPDIAKDKSDDSGGVLRYNAIMDSLRPVFAALRNAQEALALHTRAQKDRALLAAAAAVERGRARILAANAADVADARASGMKEALVDRLFLDEGRVAGIAAGIRAVAALEDPIGRVIAGWMTADGLCIEKVTVPLGVAAIIYESRPNVTADAAALAYKAGCGMLLRGSRAALRSNRALAAAFCAGLDEGGGTGAAVALADPGDGGYSGGAADYSDIDEILAARGFIDVVLPRGGRDLIRRVVEGARVPVIETGEGNCHIYVEPSADMDAALAIIENAKTQKPGACNAVETLLVHRDALASLMPALAARFAGTVELRCDAEAKSALDLSSMTNPKTEFASQTPRLLSPAIHGGSSVPIEGGSGKAAGFVVGGETSPLIIQDATEDDWGTEFLDYVLAVKTVGSLDEAIRHIKRWGTRHSEAILTGDLAAADEFCRRVDAACVYVNASTRFTDGGEFGFGAELGISTQKFHARGPMGPEALTAIKYRIRGRGHVRA